MSSDQSTNSQLSSSLEVVHAIEKTPETKLFELAKLLGSAHALAYTESARQFWENAAIAALRRGAQSGVHRGDEIRLNPHFASLTDLPEFRELAALFDRAAEVADRRLASSDQVAVDDVATLRLAAQPRGEPPPTIFAAMTLRMT